MTSCGTSAQHWQLARHERTMSACDVSGAVRIQSGVVACEQCGSTSRVGRGLCVQCLVRTALVHGNESTETLEEVLDEIEVHDADWRIGNYQILEEIGRGGMGVIYRARQRHSLRIVALKRILSSHSDSRDTLARFRREAEAAASLDHPNILPIYEVSESDDGLPFFSMKFAAGGSLLDIAPSLRRDPRRIIGLTANVARAVHYAHSHGIVHRDLKPGNILLDACGEPMVSDFGLARWLDVSSDLTKTLTIFGTPGYIAPEQAHGPAKHVTAAADIYSIGALLFDLFTGRTPFLGEHALAVIKQACEQPAPKLRTVAPLADRDIETICAKCLEREPQARYLSAGDLAEDLERWLEGRPIIARPVSPPIRIWRWSKRNPKLASSVAATAVLGVLLLAVAVPLGSSWFLTKPLPSIPEKSIAVLPFENSSDQKQNAYFTDGVQDEILTDLAKVRDLKVISRASVMHYRDVAKRNVREIAYQLGVAHILEGSVQRAGDRVRVSARLIDARTDSDVWADHYDRDITDVFALESDVAQQIVSKLKATLSPKEKIAIERQPTGDLVAYEFYRRAKALDELTNFDARVKEHLAEAARLLHEAVRRDPTFFVANCLLSRVHDEIYFWGIDQSPARLGQAQLALNTAVRLRPEAGESHLAVAHHLYWGYRNYAGAKHELRIAAQALPNEPFVFELLGYIERRQGHWNESTRLFRRALELDPRNLSLLQQLAVTFQYMRRFDDATAVLDRALTIAPDDPATRLRKAEIKLWGRADPKPLDALLTTVLQENPTAAGDFAAQLLDVALCERNSELAQQAMAALGAEDNYENSFPRSHAFSEGLVARLRGDSAAAREAFTRASVELEGILRKQPSYAEGLSMIGLVNAGLGRKEEAIREARRAGDLLPVTKDSINGEMIIENSALTYAWLGENDLALAELAIAARLPGTLSYGSLKLLPMWDPLRGDRRFEKIVTSLAPDTNTH